jgi:murein L,D-transpeptidase YafK
VPEGFYELDWFNPQSNFYLSLHVSYPNESDRILGSRTNPGGDIFLHGNCVTIGCLPITDDGIKEVYWLAVLAHTAGQTRLPIEIFPARLTDHELDQLSSERRGEPQVVEFWENLRRASITSKNITGRRMCASAGVESTYSLANEIRRRPAILLRWPA